MHNRFASALLRQKKYELLVETSAKRELKRRIAVLFDERGLSDRVAGRKRK